MRSGERHAAATLLIVSILAESRGYRTASETWSANSLVRNIWVGKFRPKQRSQVRLSVLAALCESSADGQRREGVWWLTVAGFTAEVGANRVFRGRTICATRLSHLGLLGSFRRVPGSSWKRIRVLIESFWLASDQIISTSGGERDIVG